ncbi:hypothetical protein EFE01_03780, partial [Latilactobacillus curvatus]|nr:hypothetical protein [Latilactobacillus curvatus]
GHLNVLIGIHQSRSSCLIYVIKFVQVISCNLPFKKNGVVPSNKRAQEATNVKTDAVAKSVMAMSDNDHSVVMPKLPEMTTFWPPMDSLINDVYKGKINATQYQAKLDKFVSDNAKKTK